MKKSVKYYNKINNYTKTCEIFECSQISLKRWINKYKLNNNVQSKERIYKSYKLLKIYIYFIKEQLKTNNTITMIQLHQLLKNKFKDLIISRQYFYDIIRDNNITRKEKLLNIFKKLLEEKLEMKKKN